MRPFSNAHRYDFLFAVALVVSLACFAAPDSACLQTLESNQVIRNPAKGLWGSTGKATVTFRHVLTLGVDEGEPNQTFYRPSDLDVDELGNIYVLDSGNSRVQVFDPSGRFLQTFGKSGQGPGEFSRRTKTLAVNVKESLLYVFDAEYQRLTVFDMVGHYKSSWPVQYMDDLAFDKQGKLVASNFILRSDHLPIHRYNREGKLIISFGQINDPGNNLIEMVNRSPYQDIHVLSHYGMTSLAIDKEGNIYYSQKNPYLIHKYSPQGNLLFKFTREVPFSTLHTMAIEVSNEEVRKFMKDRWATIGQISILKNGLLTVPVFSPQKDNNFIDFYASDGKLLFAAPLPIALDGPSTYIIATVFDHENNFYCLYGSQDTFPKVAKYVMTMHFPEFQAH